MINIIWTSFLWSSTCQRIRCFENCRPTRPQAQDSLQELRTLSALWVQVAISPLPLSRALPVEVRGVLFCVHRLAWVKLPMIVISVWCLWRSFYILLVLHIPAKIKIKIKDLWLLITRSLHFAWVYFSRSDVWAELTVGNSAWASLAYTDNGIKFIVTSMSILTRRWPADVFRSEKCQLTMRALAIEWWSWMVVDSLN